MAAVAKFAAMVEQGGRGRDGLARILIPLLFFCATAPTLRWVEFSGGAENIVVATAMEMRRSGERLVPTLAGEKRRGKPAPGGGGGALKIAHHNLSRTLVGKLPAVRGAFKKPSSAGRLD